MHACSRNGHGDIGYRLIDYNVILAKSVVMSLRRQLNVVIVKQLISKTTKSVMFARQLPECSVAATLSD
jgi:hypothetical protein